MKKYVILILLIVFSGCARGNHNLNFDKISHDPVSLRILLSEMPKGAELHTHLSGIPYAEDYLTWAAADNACINKSSNRIVAGPCGNNSIPVKQLFAKSNIWNTAVDAFSNRQNLQDDKIWGHDHFFATFGKFGAANDNCGRMLAYAAKQAHRDNVQYEEIMLSIYGSHGLSSLSKQVEWDGNFDSTFKKIKKAGLYSEMDQAIKEIDAAEDIKKQILGDGNGSKVLQRYINQVIRTSEPASVFCQIAWSFELVRRDPRVVAVNLVAPEDDPIAIRDYKLHMEMLDFFHNLYPDVPITLHAGELTPSLTTPEALSDHIFLAITKGHAKRIGHGVDIPYEKNAREILSLMKKQGIALECLLTSNAAILKVSGKNHPVNMYISSGVPVAFSTDDMGIARSTLTNEYVTAVIDQGLTYEDLKNAARNSLEYSFLEGHSLWAEASPYKMIKACADNSGSDKECKELLSNSSKATQQWQLEQKLKYFEKNYLLEH